MPKNNHFKIGDKVYCSKRKLYGTVKRTINEHVEIIGSDYGWINPDKFIIHVTDEEFAALEVLDA